MTKFIVNSDNIIHNLDKIKNTAGESVVIAVLKANGYGLGLIQLAKLLSTNGVNYFAVTDVNDAIKLRDEGIQGEILQLAPVLSENLMKQAVEKGITLCISSLGALKAFEEVLTKVENTPSIHINIDTGFGRYGFAPHEIEELITCVKNNDKLRITGICSHLTFACEKNEAYIRNQVDIFNQCVKLLNDEGIDGMKHIAASRGAILYPYTRMDAVRIGSAFLGLLAIENHGYKQVAHLTSAVVEVKSFENGARVGYANIPVKNGTKVAVIPCGHYDGFGIIRDSNALGLRSILRKFVNRVLNKDKKFVSIGNVRANIIGNVGLTDIIVDITGKSVEVGATATIACNPLFVNSNIERVFE